MNNEGIASWLNNGSSFTDRASQIEEYMTDCFDRTIDMGLSALSATKRTNEIYGRCLIYRAEGDKIISFAPRINLGGKIGWQLVENTKSVFWQGDCLYGLDGKKIGDLIWNEAAYEWQFVLPSGQFNGYGSDLDTARYTVLTQHERALTA